MERIKVQKTYKLYIGGSFPRTESGRYYTPKNSKDEELGNICLASRKDFRNAVQKARKSQAAWAGRSAYNIGQILYRIAENLEARAEEFAHLVVKEEGISFNEAKKKIDTSIDTIVYYAGWTDKFQQIYSSVNPVASSHFNFSMVEPMGVVSAMVCKGGFYELVLAIVTVLCGGNSIVVLAEENAPLSAITFAEVLQTSDVPAGIVNILTGKSNELLEHFASHMDVNSLLLLNAESDESKEAESLGVENLKRIRFWNKGDFLENSPERINDFLEVKTTWHPIEQIGGASSGY